MKKISKISLQDFVKQYWKVLVLLGITLFGAILRVYKLGSVPSILNPDEASIAYNALLLSEVGRDEWGRSWPLILEAFGDQKPLGYPSLVVIAFKIFGYHDWVVKLPSALAGIAIIPLTYLLADRLKFPSKLSLLSAGIVAMLPIFIFYSHIAFEAMVAVALTVCILLLTYQDHKKYQLLFDVLAIFFSLLSFFTYNSPFIILPLLLLPIPLIRGLKNWQGWLPLCIGFAMVWGVAYSTLFSFNQQKSQITIFSESVFSSDYIPYRQGFSGISQTILGNKFIFYSLVIADNYYHSFSPNFLLKNGEGHPWHAAPGTGYIYASVYMLGMIGIVLSIANVLREMWFVLRKKEKISSIISENLLMLWLLAVALFPASITVNAPHATRTLLFFVIFAIFCVGGLKNISSLVSIFLQTWSLKISQQVCALIFIGLITAETGIYLQKFFDDYANDVTQQSVHFPGFEEVIQQVDAQYSDQEVAIVDGRGFQYVLTAWYLKVSPEEFYGTIIKQLPDRINFRYGQQLKNYHFIAKQEDRTTENILLYWNGTEWIIEDFSVQNTQGNYE